MFNPLTLEAPYEGSLQTIQNQSQYDTSKGLDELLDLVRNIQESGNYYWQGISFPDSSNLVLASGVTINGTIQVPPGTYVTSINYYTGNVATFVQGAGVKIKLYDKGTKASIFYGDGDKSLDRDCMSNMQIKYGAGNTEPPFGPGYLMSPFIITPPGILGWELVSQAMDGTSQIVQVMLNCAVPINKQSIGHHIVEGTQ
jgi:hypothetical protein